MAERIEDLNLPYAVVTRLIKDALPSGVAIGKDAKLAVAKASSIFILYLTTAANTIAKNHNRKTISGADVTEAMKDIELEQFLQPLEESLEIFKKSQKEKKEAIDRKKQNNKDDASEEHSE
ncbi:DNA polymerase epsilon subunit 3-like isoform X2 [Leptopilina heterotoma]|nr:DNA polymerase epsilon subunit 3-like isoform X2 [Leptopilina heterotoma]XP_043480234.1 DNA polymerase epsilon subunit 3-like isoform X2 [Leptopilina heterotoma]XP_043480235.1 DNA polymerase epsilon subunit 3-like isoform X2 [Leptopilina heterotoma]